MKIQAMSRQGHTHLARSAALAFGLLTLAAACGSKEAAPDQGPNATSASASATASLPNDSDAWRWAPSQANGFWCGWKPVQAPLEMGPSFPIEVRVSTSKDGEPLDLSPQQIAVDARMPDHGHGMLQHVEIQQLGPGHFRVNGMRLHMLGYWELTVDVTRGAWTERAQFPIEL